MSAAGCLSALPARCYLHAAALSAQRPGGCTECACLQVLASSCLPPGACLQLLASRCLPPGHSRALTHLAATCRQLSPCCRLTSADQRGNGQLEGRALEVRSEGVCALDCSCVMQQPCGCMPIPHRAAQPHICVHWGWLGPAALHCSHSHCSYSHCRHSHTLHRSCRYAGRNAVCLLAVTQRQLLTVMQHQLLAVTQHQLLAVTQRQLFSVPLLSGIAPTPAYILRSHVCYLQALPATSWQPVCPHSLSTTACWPAAWVPLP
jgi:hypothetical protein